MGFVRGTQEEKYSPSCSSTGDGASSLEDSQVSLGACKPSCWGAQGEALTKGCIVHPAPSSSGSSLRIVRLQISLSPTNTEASCIEASFLLLLMGPLRKDGRVEVTFSNKSIPNRQFETYQKEQKTGSSFLSHSVNFKFGTFHFLTFPVYILSFYAAMVIQGYTFMS